VLPPALARAGLWRVALALPSDMHMAAGMIGLYSFVSSHSK
jgi:hypothetical protein